MNPIKPPQVNRAVASANVTRHQECPLCLEEYKSPRILPCFHTFCLTCLERLTQNQPRTGYFPCPTCRTSVQIPQGGVGKFQVNFYVEAAMVSSASGQGASARVCDMCGTQNATAKCVDCDQYACDNCKAVHARIGATRSHTVLNLNAQNQASPAVIKERYCTTHKEEKVRFFCNQCNVVLCRDCKLTSHEGHSTTDLSQRSQAAKKMLLKVSQTSRSKLAPKLKNSLKRVEQHKERLAQTKSQILTTFDERAEEIKNTVDTCLKEAKKTLEQQAESLENNVTETIATMQQQIACLESLCDHAEHVAQSGCDADILEMPSQLCKFFECNAWNMPVAAYCYEEEYNFHGQVQPHLNVEGLGVFTNENWNQTIQLTDQTYGYCDQDYYYGGNEPADELKANISQTIGTVTVVQGSNDTTVNEIRSLPIWRGRYAQQHMQPQSWTQPASEEAGGIPGISQNIATIRELLDSWTQH